MRTYRVDLIGFDGKILTAENLENATDDAAIEIARNIFNSRCHYRSVEVWQQWRLVYQERRAQKADEPDAGSPPKLNGSLVELPSA